MSGGTASEAQRWDEGAKRPKGLKGQACLLPEQVCKSGAERNVTNQGLGGETDKALFLEEIAADLDVF